MRILLAAMLLGTSTAVADVIPPEPCDGLQEGDACTTEGNEAGTCDAGGACVTNADESPPASTDDTSGCSVVSTRNTAFGFVLGSLVLMAVGARRREEV